VGDTIYLNVKEPAENLAKAAGRDARMTRMCFWGFSFEQHVTGEPLDSTKPIDTMESFCVVMRTSLGRHEIVLGAEVDCCAAGTNPKVAHGAQYIELKTTRLMDKPMQVRGFALKYRTANSHAALPYGLAATPHRHSNALVVLPLPERGYVWM
jgi:RAT1-interacting protein